jgi:hypothetical protein
MAATPDRSEGTAMHEYVAIFKCSNCRWDNDQTIEEPDKTKEKQLAIDCWHCGCSNEVVVKLVEPK